ncbi:urea ABC transporter permease subunit UrtB [Amphritea sp. 1_MG-2023]|uniref:urea ABC transporter permease subunit UrtB n=1 Tax=Amphritea sp. 1_MG-2023 TaxID=3062670 RepID=UPI0026E3F8D6|nr:urea ABC transporter permease subunit UrtB [Amphritea sp. 1_MG-2023]MDO6561977.1 urea ABC transporter permease subunit UrtB [Amphritea sp. 1_MG-2023]
MLLIDSLNRSVALSGRRIPVRYLNAICTCLLGLLISTSVLAESPSATQAPLLLQLTSVKLNQALPVLQQLEASEGADMLALFKTMQRGNLYYEKATKRLIAVRKVQGERHYSDLFSGEELSALSSKQVKKIRVNNKLRGYLGEAIARIQLHHADSEVRAAAVRSLLADLDQPTIELIREVRLNESSRSVQAVMDVALALHRVMHSQEATERLQAVKTLQGSLEPEVRNQLTQLAAQDESQSVRKAAQKGLDKIAQQAEMYSFVNQLFFGLSLGSVLLLAAIGLAITFGVMGVINMAHGEMIMLGAYTTYVVQLWLPNMIEYSLWIAVPLAFMVSGLAGVLIERLVIRHLHGRPLETLLATFGISLILQQLVRSVFSPLNRQVATPDWMSGSIEINPLLSLTLNRLYIVAFALLVFMLLLLVLKKTSLGLNVRAVSQNRDMAKAMGIRTDRVDALTFGLGSGIAGIAGVALSQLTNVGPNLGQAYIIDSFMVVVFGGVGNLWGTLVAAFTLGIANKFLEPVTGAVLASILVLVFIILFIQKRPKGLFPQKGRAAE